ncbi:MAG: DUF4476 domain-containing protein [Bacteroidota bacterium]
MKRIVTLTICLLATLSMSFAFNAEMVIQSNNGRFLLKVDGRNVNRSPQSQVIIPNMDAGSHHIVMRMVDGGSNTLQFDRVYLPQNQRSIFTLVRRGRNMMTLQKTASEPLPRYQYDPLPPRPAGPRYNRDRNFDDGVCRTAMHPADFQQALRAVYNGRSAQKQFIIAQEVLRTSCLSSRQIAKLIKGLNFEEHALRIAIMGWDVAVDPENYQVVENQIRRRAHQLTLQDYIAQHPRFAPGQNGSSCPPQGNGGYYEPGDGYYDDGYYGDEPYDDGYHAPNRAISDQQFRALLPQMREVSYDKDKLKVGKRIVEQHPLSSRQVKQLLSMISYDSYRIQLARHAYRSVVDPENFHQVKSAFTYSSYKREVEDMLR